MDAARKFGSRESFETEALGILFSNFSAKEITYAVLRNYESLPKSVGARDIDILVIPEHLSAAIAAVCNLANKMQLTFAHYYADERLTQFSLVYREHTKELLDIKIDLFTNSQIFGVEVFSARKMLEDVRLFNGIPVVSDKFIFLDKWLFHVLVGVSSHSKYDVEFANICSRYKENLLALLDPLLGKSIAKGLIDSVIAGNASSTPPLPKICRQKILRSILIGNGLKGLAHTISFIWHRIKNIISPSGIFLSLSGPDGCGKTTVIDDVVRQLGIAYGVNGVIYRHFRPAALPRIADIAKAAHAIKSVDTDYANPHRAKPSGIAGSLGRLAYYCADYFIGYFRAVRPILIKRQVALYDRYYFDMICDPGRSRIGLPFSLLRFFGKLLPLPQYAFFIHVNPDEIFRRKQELSLAQIKLLNEKYSLLVDQGLLVKVDNERPFEVAAAEIVDHIVMDRDMKARNQLKKFFS